jgi:hypothetical protein
MIPVRGGQAPPAAAGGWTPARTGETVALVPCMGCRGTFPDEEGPTHAYMQSTPGCWAAFGRVLAREYSDPLLLPVHRLTVDAYAVQHPGVPSRQSIQSVGVHLVRLCLFLEHNLAPEQANAAMLAAARHKSRTHWLAPPSDLGPLTVADVDAAGSVEAHMATVRRWASQLWQVWAPHHAVVRSWATPG